jgi:cytochrome c peroxidase
MPSNQEEVAMRAQSLSRFTTRLCLICVPILIAFGAGLAFSQALDPPRPPSLKTVPVPEPANLSEFVKDRQAAIALGKALFWDMQVGSDGVTACASCHFSSGMADTRSINQLSPGLNRVTKDAVPNPDTTFANGKGPNAQLTASDFPLFPANDVVSSQGVFNSVFRGVTNAPDDQVRHEPDQQGFAFNGRNVRRVEPRNTPSVINAVFNHRQFWDGRADNVFNGVNGLGDRDPNVRVFRADDPNNPVPVQVRLENSSLASQAVNPPVNSFEMSAAGRTMRDLGRKLAIGTGDDNQDARQLRPLGLQLVHPEDSVLGLISQWPYRGLKIGSYREMIRRAFHRQWWDSPQLIRVDAQGLTRLTGSGSDSETETFTLMQYNFALFFGLAIQMYESTLVADDSPYDRFMDGDASAISQQAQLGVDLFRSQARGRCINCHEGAELTGASVRRARESPTRIREGQAMDRGFNNISVNWTTEDLGVGGKDDFGNWLSTVKRLNPPPVEPIVVDGAFKVPGLRNVELTAPYFHNGGHLTLRSVLDFYSVAGDATPAVTLGGTIIRPLTALGTTEEEANAFEAFLLSLTDERVRFQKAPFDHPQLLIPNGMAEDRMMEVPAVGRLGGQPQKKFLEP